MLNIDQLLAHRDELIADYMASIEHLPKGFERRHNARNRDFNRKIKHIDRLIAKATVLEARWAA
jgi:hypothetical protein